MIDEEVLISNYYKTWVNGIKDEALFWDKLFATGGECGGNKKVFEYRINPNCPFQLEEDLEHDRSKIIDIGSGPYSRLGFCMDGKKLDITLLDPLASVYRILGQKYKIDFPIKAQTGMVELLHYLFKQNEFDFVHMSNSLDHCFNPIVGIKELIYITKVGGKIVLRHSENEAEHENYNGFHQWNLSLRDNKFVIWRNDELIDVNEYIRDYADIEYAHKTSERLFDDVWEYNKVVIRKKKEIKVDDLFSPKIIRNIIDVLVSQNAMLLSELGE